jgi:hypothetical protein
MKISVAQKANVKGNVTEKQEVNGIVLKSLQEKPKLFVFFFRF